MFGVILRMVALVTVAAPAQLPTRRPTPVERVAPVNDWRNTFATICGRVVLLGAIWSIFSIILRPVHWIHWIDDIFGVVNLPVAPSFFSIAFLFVLSGAVQRRKRIALWVLIVLQALALALLGTVVGLAIFDDSYDNVKAVTWVLVVAGGVVSAVLLVLLWAARAAFPSRLEPGALRRALVILIVGIAASVGLSLALTFAFPRSLGTVGRKIAWAIRGAIGLEPDQNDAGWANHHGHHWTAVVVSLISAAALVIATVTFLRSAQSKNRLTSQEELDIRRLLLRDGERDSLGYFATRHEKAVVFSPNGQAAVTYRVLSSVSLASADPIGPPSEWHPAIESWLAQAQEFGWFPAALSASEEGAKAYVRAGLKALLIGDESIIVDTFHLDGPTMQQVRQAVNRVAGANYQIAVVRHSELSDAELAEIEARAEDWRGDETERGFSMALGRLGNRSDGRCVAVLARDPEGQLRGLLSFVPWGARGLSLDLMRRDPKAENGVVEAMVVATIEAGRDTGIRRISLNFAMFRGVFSAAERVGAGPLVRLGNRVLLFASRFYQLDSLYRSNARYLPRWEPRYLCYDGSLTRVVIAAGVAEGFLPTILPPPADRVDEPVTYDGLSGMPFVEAVLQQDHDERNRLPTPKRLTEQQRVRRAKIDALSAQGIAAYPVGVPRTTSVAEVVADGRPDIAVSVRTGETVSVAGRVAALRDFGGLVFAVVREAGASVQIAASISDLGDTSQALLRHTVDIGDYISVTGDVGRSDKGELTIFAHSWVMASKCLRPMPDLRKGITDPDTRVRQRYLYLIANPEAGQMLRRRSTAVHALRSQFIERGYLEVETPMLQAVHGGANARPFRTHINAYNTELFLRIAPELFLKRLCVGGVEKVFELNRNFRNEGADSTHNPEFTSLEAYAAYSDYDQMRELTREVIIAMANAVYGAPVACRTDAAGRPIEIDLSGPWPAITVHAAISAACQREITADTEVGELREICAANDVHAAPDAGAGDLVSELYDQLIEKNTQAPTFYLDFPVETSPLTRPHRTDPRLAERWDLVAFGAELGTAYSELIDPIDQRARLLAQSLKAAGGDADAMSLDEDFLTALEYSMPPTGGLGLGVDRLVMMLTGASIRQTLAFPFVRPTGR
jgi:lysyl-tRNA synthetase, class II